MKTVTIGRNTSNDVLISDPYVSGQHAVITQNDDGTYSISDLGSRNGTYVNGKKIRFAALYYNDIVKIGERIIPWQEYFLTKLGAFSGKIIRQLTIGRNADNDIVIPDEFVSGKHAVLCFTDRNEVVVQDLGSTNGIFVNDCKVDSVRLNVGDSLHIARSPLRWTDYDTSPSKYPRKGNKTHKSNRWVILMAIIVAGALVLVSGWFVGVKMGIFKGMTTDSIASDTMPNFSNLNELVKYAEKAVFLIESDNSDGKPIAYGTGFFVSSSGIGITNAHVLRGGTTWKIKTSDGQMHAISVIMKINNTYDYAIFKVISDESFYSLRISNTPPEKGHDIFVLGNPQGIESTLTKGIISGLKGGTEQEVVEGRFSSGNSYIQIDVAISHGSSGSPVMNMKGEVIGIATLSFEEAQCSNCNFALNIDMLKDDLEEVRK